MSQDDTGWLILGRKEGEAVVIGDGLIIVKLIEIRGNHARIGFRAPKDIQVNRQEVHERKEAERAADSQA